MCGFAGFLDLRASGNSAKLEEIVANMSACLARRGPDASGVWTDERAGVAFGHRRLSILDLSETGAQPMISASGRTVIVLNGEIYNFGELRSELESLGHAFRGRSDTEVLLEAIERFGVCGALRRAVGMFAMAVWDRASRTLTLARDRMGEKPLYYGWAGKSLLFGSTPRALTLHPEFEKRIDRDALALYFQTNYIPAPHCIWRGVRKLMPGTFLRIGAAEAEPGKLDAPTPYWSLEEVVLEGEREPFGGSDVEALDRLEALLADSVRGQMISDVPLGAFLSGGIDSTTVVALMQKQSARPVKTFTIGFSDTAYDESRFARPVAKHLGTDHTELMVSDAEAMSIIPQMPELYDEPFADSSMVPTCLVAQMARREVTVALTGDGGDEVFCGYNRHAQLMRLHERFGKLPYVVRRLASKAILAVPTRSYDRLLRRKKSGVLGDQVMKAANLLTIDDLEAKYQFLTTIWPNATALVKGSSSQATILSDRSRWPRGLPPLRRLLWAESMTSLPDDMLVKLDRAGMAFGLEARMPLLDRRVMQFAWSLPDRFRIRDRQTKWALRQVLYRHVPKEMMDRPKSGFGLPIDEWLVGPLRPWAESLLDERRLDEQGLLEPSMVRAVWSEHVSGRRKWQARIWSVLMLQAWLEREKAGIAA